MITGSKLPEPANAKTRELLMYVADRLKDVPNYGATLLNKVLYFIDHTNYLVNKRPISNLNYVKQDFGPTPIPSQFLPLKEDLIDNDEMTEIKSDFFGLVQKKCLPNRKPNTDVFDKDEIILIDRVIAVVATHNANSISEISHRFLAWKLAENMEKLPYYTFLLTSKAPTDSDIAWANSEIEKYTA